MTSLAERVYTLLKTVPRGRVTTYKALAKALGTNAYRAIGQIMKNNPYSFEACPERSRRVPCHRVVASDGTIGGFKGKKSGSTIKEKIALLQSEGVSVKNNRVVDFNHVKYDWNKPIDNLSKRAL